MKSADLDRDSELQRVLLACYEYWQNEPLPTNDRFVCYSWVIGIYQRMFGGWFHQAKLYQLTKLGFLKQDDTSRSGHRRYYKIVNPGLVEGLAKQWASQAQ